MGTKRRGQKAQGRKATTDYWISRMVKGRKERRDGGPERGLI
jgi:hypothetical protein